MITECDVKLPFMFGIHCHQPVENFYHVVDEVTEKSYAPFLKVALKNKSFKFAVHYSGWLLEYIRKNHSETFANLKTLSDRGQIEFFTAGFYEPVLSAIPAEDRYGQIKMLSDYVNNHFGVKPTGMWLTERVWDPSIIPAAAECGVKNIIIDDYHLISVGFPKESITSYFKTEQDGYDVNLFPIDMKLRYLTPFKPVEQVIEHMHDALDKKAKLITCFDDGEKFGVWPGTFEHVYKNGWLDKFIKAVRDDDKVEFMHYSDAVEKIKPAGVAYLPITSYEEMGEWSLFADKLERFEQLKDYVKDSQFKNDMKHFVKGSIWKNFFAKYPESNRLHKRTLDLSKRAKPYKNDDKLTDAIYRSQCNDSLWHGVFGGLYLPNLRNNAWGALIEAETMYEKLAGVKYPQTEIRDMDIDGYDEVFVRTENINYQFVSRDCGQLGIIELKDKNFNLLNTISRKMEGYHTKYTVDDHQEENTGEKTIHEQSYHIPPEVKEKIAYDWYNKNCFIDHFACNFTLDTYERCTFQEIGDFANQAAELTEKAGKLTFKRDGGVYVDVKKYPLKLTKTYNVDGGKIDFTIAAKTTEDVECVYAQEFNFHFCDLSKVWINDELVTDRGEFVGKKIKIEDYHLKKCITIEYDREVTFMYYNIYTVSQSEAGIDLTSQGLSISASVPFEPNFKLSGSMGIANAIYKPNRV